MKIRKIILTVCILFTCSTSYAQEAKPITVGMVLDGPSILVDEILGLIQQEILTLTKDEFDIRFPEDKIVVADWTLEGNRKGVTQLLEDADVDIILTLGVISTSDIIKRGPLSKPVIASVVLDAKIQNAPLNGNASGVKNLSYTAIASEFEENIEESRKNVDAKFVTVLTNRTIDIAIPNLNKRLKKNLKDLGAEVELLPLGESIEETLNEINPSTDVVLVAHQTFLSVEDKLQIVNGLIKRKLPSFAMAGKREVELGFLMSTGQDEVDIKRLSRRAALNLQSILLGESPSELPVFFTSKRQLSINMETARKIGFSPKFEMLEEAVLINNDFKIAEPLSIIDAVKRSLDKNLNLAAKGKEVEAGYQQVKSAWSALLPQINLSNSYTGIDEDRALAGAGATPERTASASAVFNQVLFSEDTFANVSIQKNTQKSLEGAWDELKLDIVEATTIAYLNVLRTERIRAIQINNLELSRSNLELAKIRKKVGQSSAADIYRWESEIANNQKEILTAKANLRNAQIALNRLLHRPLETEYDFHNVGMEDEQFFLSKELPDYIQNPYTFQLLRDFFVKEGISVAPEVKQIEALIKVRERSLSSNQRDFWIPEVSFQATVTDNYHKDGVGEPTTSAKNDRDFTATIKATYPLFEGGNKVAAVKKAKRELEQFELQLASVKEQVEEEIRSTLQDVGNSHASIKWSNKSAQAAAKNLELVQDSYSEGANDITVLLDAQNASLNADQVAANAVYDFFIDYFEFQRAIRKFYFRSSDDEKRTIMKRFVQYFRENGVDL